MSSNDEPPKVCPRSGGTLLLPKSSSQTSLSSEPPDTSDHVCPHSKAKVIRTKGPTTNDTVPEGEIPSTGRGNSEDGQAWLNPSANQLYHALSRRNKPIEYNDAASVATMHQMVTAQTWQAILEYEDLHKHTCATPKLAKFEGKDGIYSKKAQFFHWWFGMPLPYDRHDWTVDRCGKEVTYIIDYYAVPVPRTDSDSHQSSSFQPQFQPHSQSQSQSQSISQPTSSSSPQLDNEHANSNSSQSSFYQDFITDDAVDFVYSIDARPKLNRISNVFDRIRVAYRHWKSGDSWY
ncbi:hypothetical protein RFI_35321 [Reticulomyxa filosa]|uniref:Holocytochrome c-type synthase n=1 Tax=Reticulomyxa filosa TaxID=46433 RepID=X6LL64_RETFI|nr:hypothetical protein RFI_35321 [Reticulomyxa filosa]|eukprot:ETO02116.1 hypothetical protein RFI_35321 [Reticulomyxa filosa]